jgi:CIC family chloride channel protein
VIGDTGFVLNEENEIGEAREWLEKEAGYRNNYFVIVNNEHALCGIVSSSSLFGGQHDIKASVGSLIRRKSVSISLDATLKEAVELMIKENIDVLPVVSHDLQLAGILSHGNILSAYKLDMNKYHRSEPHISIKRQSMKILIKGQRLVTYNRNRE